MLMRREPDQWPSLRRRQWQTAPPCCLPASASRLNPRTRASASWDAICGGSTMSDKTNRDPGWDDVRVTYSSDISNYASDGAQLSADEDAVRLWHVGITRLEWDDDD